MANVRETEEQALARWGDLHLLQEHYAEFSTFLQEVIEDFMGFQCTEVQQDIGAWVAYGPKYRMVQAQRGQAKTTITAAYAVWRCIMDPTTRVLIISAGSDMATEIANWIIQIIMGMPELECLRPDRSAGDRSSVSAFDIHYSLKGPEKSPSIACIGITSNMQGKRADLLIADDVESSKNSQTQVQKARIHHLTLDFTSICSNGDIVWLGTPQSIDSLYNGLPGRGTAIRIWPGRYPTEKEEEGYDGFLAPWITDRIAANPSLRTGGGPIGDRGQPVDPVLLGEETLTAKEIDQGAAYFQLQHMLSTKLADADRYPLKTSQIRFCGFDAVRMNAPMTLSFVRTSDNEIKMPDGFPIKDKFYLVQKAEDFGALLGPYMYVDPGGGGQNGDETAYAVTAFCAGRVYVLASGGVKGGLDPEVFTPLTNIALKWRVKAIAVEQNFGNGALRQVWQPLLMREAAKEGLTIGIEDVWESGQKELRIIDILEPLLGAGKLVMSEELILQDWNSIQKHPSEIRHTYSLFWQLARITRDKKSLIHEDRLDALAGAVRMWIEAVNQDSLKAVAKAQQEAYKKMMQNPLGDGRTLSRQLQQVQTNRFGLGKIGRLGR
ncbi:terminase large subunit protein [Rhizobium phage RHph_TM33]|uniref:Terminase large subunit protein n=1 Tax=Rhizobium phage RHph_TM33 TaxID=2509765 RepID=A0A7S5QYY9_9CAUD|nr:terminase large subunit protein [Rhizobium phage RHph_TM33]QIG68506.1 terminase large subunit protein [Rhizobium phage RHph_TM38]